MTHVELPRYDSCNHCVPIFQDKSDFGSQSIRSNSLYNTDGLRGYVPIPDGVLDPEYVGKTDPRDPVLSPINADLHNMPPTLFITSERDLLLSATSSLSRAFVRAGNQSQLIVFGGLPHCFWNNNALPESREAWGYMANFFDRELGR